jgi:uncharacterized protein
MSDQSPCLTCGACCGFFRVSFYWGECESAGGYVPDALTVPLSPHRACMAGTERNPVRCSALAGEIGAAVSCTIYENRPSPCREFSVHGEQGPNEDCNRARALYGLEPLL